MVMLVSCATVHFGKMTPAQKYGTYRATFNDVIEHQYIPWAKKQPEEKKVLLRAEANPLIKDVEKALDVYSAELIKPGGDPEAKMQLFLNVKNDLYVLLLKYGLKVDESKGGTQ
jgi:hypothetical protein